MADTRLTLQSLDCAQEIQASFSKIQQKLYELERGEADLSDTLSEADSLVTSYERQGQSHGNPRDQIYGNSMERARALATELMLSGKSGQATNSLFVIPSNAAHLAWRT